MSRPNYTSRRNKLRKQIRSRKLDGLLVSGESNVRYLTGFTGDSTWLLATRKGEFLISDTRYETQLAEECAGVSAEIRDARTTLEDFACELVAKQGLSSVGVEAQHLTLAGFSKLSDAVSNTDLVAVTGVVEELRQIKDKWEISETRQAVFQAERGISAVSSQFHPEQTERDVRFQLEAAMRKFGADGTAFEPIVGVGPTGALPHAHAGFLQLQDSPALLIDWGARTFSGYRSDLTRCFFPGRPTKKMKNVYELVLAAQQAAIAALRPGAVAKDIDRIARGMIESAGYGKMFGHGLGHGIGLDIHESVRLSPVSEQVLEPGMILTVEPGIYIPGDFGVRIEDDVLITSDGYDVLTSVPRDFDSAVVDYLA